MKHYVSNRIEKHRIKRTNLLCIYKFKIIYLVRNSVRYASKKTGTSSANVGGNVRPKKRGIKFNDGTVVTQGSMLVLQRELRFHPGLHVSVLYYSCNIVYIYNLFAHTQVGFGRNGTLFALESGKVIVTCEKMNPNWNHTWIQRIYGNRKGQTIYKKYFNIIPNPQHNRFKLVETI